MSEIYVSSSLKTGSSYQSSKINRIRVQPSSGSGTHNPGSILRFDLPARTILQLSSASLVADLTISGLVTHADNRSNATIPSVNRLFSRVCWYVNGIALTPSFHYDQLSNMLLKCTASEDYCRTRQNAGYLDLIQHLDDSANEAQRPLDGNAAGGATSKVTQIVADEWLGIPNSNSGYGVLDCGIFGNVSVEITLNSDTCLKVASGGTGSIADITYSLSNIHFAVNSIVSVPDTYLKMMQLRLSSSVPISFAFQNYQVQLNGNHAGTGIIRQAISCNSLDLVMCAPLASTFATRAAQVLTNVNPPRYTYDSGRTHANQKNAQIGFTIGSTAYPSNYKLSGFEALDVTHNTFSGFNRFANNLLCAGTTNVQGNSAVYTRDTYLSQNAIFAMALSDQHEGWSSPDKILSGINVNSAGNSEIIWDFTNWGAGNNGHMITAALYTSVLSYDPVSATVQLIQ